MTRMEGTKTQKGYWGLSGAPIALLLLYAFSRKLVMLAQWQRKNHLRMTHGKASVANVSLNFRREFQKSQCIRDRDSALADFCGHVFLAQLKLFE